MSHMYIKKKQSIANNTINYISLFRFKIYVVSHRDYSA